MTIAQSLVVCILFALVYARLEVMIESGGRKWQPIVGKFSYYHLWLGLLNAIVNLPALTVSWRLWLFTIILFALLEDIFYFMWLWSRIRMENWTVKGLPYLRVKGWIIPGWYLIAVYFLVLLMVLM